MSPAPHADRDASEEPRRYAEGGYIPGPPAKIRVEHLGYTKDGYRQVGINDGPPEFLLTPEQVRTLGALPNAAEPPHVAAGAPQTPSGQSGTDRDEMARQQDAHDVEACPLCRAEAAEAEARRLAGIVEQVRALARNVAEVHAELPEPHGAWTRGYDTALRDVLAILDSQAPTEGSE